MDEILRVEGLNKRFTKKSVFQAKPNTVIAVNDVSFSLGRDEILAIAGQSGSGKSTIAKLILRAIEFDSGKIFFEGNEISNTLTDLKKLTNEMGLNNDVKFSENWSNILINEMIKNKSVAAGPITNGPGNRPKQDIRNYINNYVASDKDKNINLIANKILKNISFNYRTINGFCMAFNVKWLNTLNKPIINSNNPNFAGEEILFKKYPCKPLIVSSSYIFHYKQVTVSRKNFKKQHFRKDENSSL